MTTESEDKLADQILHGDAGHILPPDSFTGQRLRHASARHLHLTSRRVFIGPIPEAWIADHRKSWANYKPRVLTTYSSRSATFNAASTVPELRALTGLDVDGDHKRRHRISFPQPADVGDVSSDASVQDDEQVVPEQDDPEVETQENSTRPSVLSTANSYASTGLESYVTAPTKQRGPKSFVTAKERLDSTPEAEEDVQTNDPEPETTSPKPADEGFDRTSPTVSKHDSMVSNNIRRSDSHDSTQALLTQDERNAQVTSSKPKKRVRIAETLPGSSISQERPSPIPAMHELPPEAYDGDDVADVIDTESARPGLVRFNLPAGVAGKRDRLRETVSRAKEKVIGKDSPSSLAEPGQLLKAERMLVRVEVSKHDIPNDYEEKYSAKAESQLLEKWREYVVTCRKDIDGDGFVLLLAKTRVLPVLANESVSKKVAHRIVLKPHVTKVNLFSPLDKTIVIWQAEKKSTKIFILRPRSPVSSIEWLTFLNLILGYKFSDTLHVSVPDLDVVLEVANPLLKPDAADKDGSIESNGNPSGTDPKRSANDGHGARQIMMKALRVLQNSDFQDVLVAWREKDERLGLVWRQYDRLDWVHGVSEQHMYGTSAMQKTHELEIRPKVHYPTSTSTKAGRNQEELEEPEPVEGFLVLQTSQKGRESMMGKTYFKKLYFSTHNHLLCFSTPDKAVPPKPPELKKALHGGARSAGLLANKVPLIYTVDPYPLEDGKVSWFSDSNPQEIEEHDHRAYEENERALHLLIEADGYINICHIKHVRKYKPHKDGELPPTSDHDDSDAEDESNANSSSNKNDIQRSFVLHLNNGLAVRLQAYDKVARKEWVKRLRLLSAYWKHRTVGDIGFLKDVRQQNLTGLGIDEETESIVGQVAEKWEVSKSIASPELFHMCGISRCRQVTMSGILYRKPRMHSSFRKCMAVLCHGKLLIFQATLRTYSGRERLHVLHEKEEVVDLKESYVYSGSLTEDDLLYQNKTFDSNHPGHNALPRVFREDDWTSIDEDSTTCFVIWHGRRKSFFKANAEKGNGTFMSQIRYVSTLGVPGRSMVFKTRSRAERDHWVTNVNMEIERLQRTEDIRVVESK